MHFLAYLLVGEVNEVVCLVDQEYLQCSSGHVVPARMDLSKLGQGNLEVGAVPCGREGGEGGREDEGGGGREDGGGEGGEGGEGGREGGGSSAIVLGDRQLFDSSVQGRRGGEGDVKLWLVFRSFA